MSKQNPTTQVAKLGFNFGLEPAINLPVDEISSAKGVIITFSCTKIICQLSQQFGVPNHGGHFLCLFCHLLYVLRG